MKHTLIRQAALSTVALLSATGVASAATGANPLGVDWSPGHDRPALEQPAPTLQAEADDPPPPSFTTTSTSTTTSSTTSTTSTSTTTSTTTTSTTAVPPTAAEACTENHGAKVSAVAKDKSNDGDQNHGAVVSAAAHDKEDCTDVADTDDAEKSDDSDSQEHATQGKKSGTTNPGRGHSQGHGQDDD